MLEKPKGKVISVACPMCHMAHEFEEPNTREDFFMADCQFCPAIFRVEVPSRAEEIRRQFFLLGVLQVFVYVLAGIFILACVAAITAALI